MSRYAASLVLAILLVIIHAQLWLGRGSIPNVAGLQTRLQTQLQANQQALQVNHQLRAELGDLKDGLEMIEEKARMELGMIKPDEIYVQISR